MRPSILVALDSSPPSPDADVDADVDVDVDVDVDGDEEVAFLLLILLLLFAASELRVGALVTSSRSASAMVTSL